jgi:ParB-like chromosome segregation protein Spo0J
MTEVRIADLLANAPIDPTAHLDRERVAHYALAGRPLPPVVVFETEDGPLLVDGYHRLAAARLRGAETIGAEVRHGTRAEALRHVVEHAARQRGITLEQALERVRAYAARNRR